MSFVDLAKLTMHRRNEMESRINVFNEKCDHAISDIKKLKMQSLSFLSQLNCDPVELKERFLTLMKKLDEYTYLITDFNLALAQIEDIKFENTPEQDNSVCQPTSASATPYSFNTNNLMDALSEPVPSTSCACSNLCLPEKPKRVKVPKEEQVLIAFSSSSSSSESVPSRKSEMVEKEVQCSLEEEMKSVTLEAQQYNEPSCPSRLSTGSARTKASAAQLKYLTSYMRLHRDMAIGTNKMSLDARFILERKWKKLAYTLNCMDGTVKTVPKWKQTWRDLKNNIVRKASKKDVATDEEQEVLSTTGLRMEPVAVYVVNDGNTNEMPETRTSLESSSECRMPKRGMTRSSTHLKKICRASIERKKATTAQLNYLAKYMIANLDLSTSHFNRSLHGQQELEMKWKYLANKLNCMGGSIKSVARWKQAWRDLKCNARKKAVEINQMSPNEDHVLDVMDPDAYVTEEIVSTEVMECPPSPQPQRSTLSYSPELHDRPSRQTNCKENVLRTKATSEQLEYLTEYMRVNADMALPTPTSRTLQQRVVHQNKWAELARKLNTLRGPIKDVTKWKQAWRDLRNNLRKKTFLSKEMSDAQENVLSVIVPEAFNLTEDTLNTELMGDSRSPQSITHSRHSTPSSSSELLDEDGPSSQRMPEHAVLMHDGIEFLEIDTDNLTYERKECNSSEE